MLNNKMIIICALTLFSFALISCKENTVEPVFFGSIAGKVVDSKTGLPISAASITTNPSTNAIVTDNAGAFNIKDIQVGSYTITAKKNGYKTGSVSIMVKENATAQASILLEDNPTTNTLNVPKNPIPANQATQSSVALTLSWSSNNTGADNVKYDVYLYNSKETTPIKIASEISDTLVDVKNLEYSKTYFWQVIVKDTNSSVNGDVWSFTTKAFPNNPFAFVRKVDGVYKLFTSDSTETNLVQLINTNGKEIYPRFSPKKNKIAFASDVSLQPQIYTANLDGSDVQQITNLAVTGYNNIGIGFSWAPDGGSLIYSHYNKLYRINNDGSNLTEIATAPADRHFRECEFSPLADKIVVETIGVNVYDNEIYIMNSNGTNMQMVVGNLSGIVERPSFSPDGKSILFTNDVSGFESATGRQLNSHMFLKRLADSVVTDVSFKKNDGTNDTNPRFSPDGGSIIFNNALNDGSSEPDIFIIDINGENRHKIISAGLMPDWKR